MSDQPIDISASPLAAPQSGALALTSQAPVAKLLEAVISKGLTQESVGVVERLVDLYERMQTKDAEKQFNASFVALQSEIPTIVASTTILNRGKYERFEDLMHVLKPLLVKHGFSVSFTQDFKDSRIVETCHLKHTGGHSQSNSFAVRAGGKADSDTQADCKASTTAKRYALQNALNLIIRQDALNDEDDVSLEGELISPEKVQYLREQVAETRSDASKFLALAGVDSFEEIRSGSYDVLVRALAAKARAK